MSSNFGGKKAAPFKSKSTMAAKRRKAKAMLKRKVGQDLANLSGAEIDLGFNPLEPRDKFGQWVRGTGAVKSALSKAQGGSVFESKGVKWTRGADDIWFPNKDSINYSESRSAEQIAVDFTHGILRSPDDLRIQRDQAMNVSDKRSLARKAKKQKDAHGLLARLKSGSPVINTFLANEDLRDLIDLAMAESASGGRGRIARRDTAMSGRIRNKRASTMISNFQKAHGLKVTGEIDSPTKRAAAKAATAGAGKNLRGHAVLDIAKGKKGAAGTEVKRLDRRLAARKDKIVSSSGQAGWSQWNQWRKSHPGASYADYKAQQTRK